MRCLTLAHELSRRGATIQFICRECPGHLIEMIIAHGYPVHRLSQNINDQISDAAETLNILRTLYLKKINWLIVDHYALNAVWEMQFRCHVEKIMVIDDLANRKHECDVLMDQTLGREQKDYFPWIPQQCHLLLGTKYALLRNEFNQLRQEALLRRQQLSLPKKVLVSFGGADPDNVTAWIVQTIKKKNLGLQFDIIIGPNMQQRQPVISENNFDFIHVHPQVDHLAEYMLQADIAIGAGGTTSWERCCLGLPTLLIIIAANQKQVAKKLAEAGAVKLLGQMPELQANDLIQALTYYVQHPALLLKMSQQAAMICDGFGARRVANALLPVQAHDGKPIYLRPASMEDADMMLQWQRHPSTRQYARRPEPPTLEEH